MEEKLKKSITEKYGDAIATSFLHYVKQDSDLKLLLKRPEKDFDKILKFFMEILRKSIG